MNGGGWYEFRTEDDRQARLENCCDGWSGQYRYTAGTFKDVAGDSIETRKSTAVVCHSMFKTSKYWANAPSVSFQDELQLRLISIYLGGRRPALLHSPLRFHLAVAAVLQRGNSPVCHPLEGKALFWHHGQKS